MSVITKETYKINNIEAIADDNGTLQLNEAYRRKKI